MRRRRRRRPRPKLEKLFGLIVAASVAALYGCHRSDMATAEWRAPVWWCGLDRHPQSLSPRPLVDAFVGHASAGDFGTSGEWLRSVVDCPDREPAFDTFAVVRGYKLSQMDSGAEVVHYLLTLDVIGDQDVRFHRRPRVAIDTITVRQTAYGWRLRTPTPWNWLTVSSGIRQGWLSAKDTL